LQEEQERGNANTRQTAEVNASQTAQISDRMYNRRRQNNVGGNQQDAMSARHGRLRCLNVCLSTLDDRITSYCATYLLT